MFVEGRAFQNPTIIHAPRHSHINIIKSLVHVKYCLALHRIAHNFEQSCHCRHLWALTCTLDIRGEYRFLLCKRRANEDGQRWLQWTRAEGGWHLCSRFIHTWQIDRGANWATIRPCDGRNHQFIFLVHANYGWVHPQPSSTMIISIQYRSFHWVNIHSVNKFRWMDFIRGDYRFYKSPMLIRSMPTNARRVDVHLDAQTYDNCSFQIKIVHRDYVRFVDVKVHSINCPNDFGETTPISKLILDNCIQVLQGN